MILCFILMTYTWFNLCFARFWVTEICICGTRRISRCNSGQDIVLFNCCSPVLQFIEDCILPMQPAKKIYESLLASSSNSMSLAHIQVKYPHFSFFLLVLHKSTDDIPCAISTWFFLFLMQFIRFLRRTEGVEAARKYFLDARKSPSCTYHVFVAYAMMVFCVDKDPKVYDRQMILVFISFCSASKLWILRLTLNLGVIETTAFLFSSVMSITY